jgi:serine/threonine protein kinase
MHVGTEGYHAPEEIRNCSFVSDVYGTGLCIYEMLIGNRYDYNNPIPLSPQNCEYSKPLCQLVMSMLAVDPTKRPSAKGVFVLI